MVEDEIEVKEKKKFCLNFSERFIQRTILFLFVALWAVLVLFEYSQLYRIQNLSLFLQTELFFEEAMRAPAGLLSYAGAFLMQFFYYPALGAAIYVALLYAAYLLVRKVFDIPRRWALVALLPLVFVVATNSQMGYWIYYIKIQGFYYVLLLGVIVMLLAMWACKKLPMWAKFVFVALWAASYPLFGVFSLAGAIFMAVSSFRVTKGRVAPLLLLLFAVALVAAVPALYYYCYTSNSLPLMYLAAVPGYQWSFFGGDWFASVIWPMWIPYVLLFVTFLLMSALYGKSARGILEARYSWVQVALMLFVVGFSWCYWFTDENFHAENAQDRALWNEDWQRVVELGKVDGTPTRLIVMNRNIALLRLGRAGEDMFTLPDGSATMNSPVSVRLTQTGGKMAYYQYGRFSFCYRWCIEDAVEYGWKVEYLKHAVRSMMAVGEYKLASRYINILKKTMFHRSWAEECEALISKPQSIERRPEFVVPRQLFSYKNTLDVDDSYVEAYLMNAMTSALFVNPGPLCTEASLMHALIRKDTQLFWNTLIPYLSTHKTFRIPTHYQEAIMLYGNIDRRADISKFKFDASIQQRFREFMKLTSKYKGMTEEQMAPYFKEAGFGDTYWYFYFFVRDIKSN